MSIAIYSARNLIITTFLFFMLPASQVAAEIYKWVDAHGRTHYSDTKLKSDKSSVEVVKLSPSANSYQSNLKPQQRSEYKQSTFKNSSPTTNQARTNSSQNRQTNKDIAKVDYRCTLARRILNGEARLTNGLPTGKHEIKVAQRDVQKFCP